MKILAALVTIAVIGSGCALRTLRQSLDVAHQQASLEGTVALAGGESLPIVVAVEEVDSGRIADLFLLARPGPYVFVLPPGRYRVAAFADRRRDLTYQPDLEPAALLGSSGEIVLGTGERRRGADLTIDPARSVVIPFAVSAPSPDDVNARIPALQIGAVTTLDDARFVVDNGSLGLWDPLRFMAEAGAGVYFLEEYDPDKIPILFVHGATGSPADWKYVISKLDRSTFQPWFAYDPAAPHLDQIGDQIVRAISSLLVKYDFESLLLIAHSMGGLVTRSALDHVIQNPGAGRILDVPLFLSISTPWGGVASATMGVKYAPVVAPMWEDMAPGSTFLEALPRTPLPAETEYDLFFGYRNDSALSPSANDGTVTVASQLCG